MSLTSFLAQNADVRERFKLEFRKPAFTAIKPLLAPPLTTHYTTVGTAFDYLLRFVIQRLNPLTLDKGYWVAEVAADALIEADLYIRHGKLLSLLKNIYMLIYKVGFYLKILFVALYYLRQLTLFIEPVLVTIILVLSMSVIWKTCSI